MNLFHPPITLGYIDPGSGAMLLQWLIAGIAGVGFYFRRVIGKLFRRLFGKGDKTDDQEDTPSDK